MGKTRDLKKIRNTKGTFHAKESESEFAQSCPTVCDPMDCSPPGSSSMGFSRQEYWRGCHFLLQGNLPDPGIEPRSPALQADALTSELPGKPKKIRDTKGTFHAKMGSIRTKMVWT